MDVTLYLCGRRNETLLCKNVNESMGNLVYHNLTETVFRRSIKLYNANEHINHICAKPHTCVGLFGLQLDFRIQISSESNENVVEINFERDFSPFRIHTLTLSHPCSHLDSFVDRRSSMDMTVF